MTPDSFERSRPMAPVLKVSILAGWLCTSVGFFGPWFAHRTAALTLTGVDLAEFSKFLPQVIDGSVQVVRQVFYVPVVAVAAGIALMVGSRELHYRWLVRSLSLLLGFFLGLELLPPAWSLASLAAPEYRLQLIALGCAWALLAGFWLWGRLPVRLTGSGAAALALAAAALAAWQYSVIRPAVPAVYQTRVAVGWGLVVCLVGLAILVCASLASALARPWRDGSQR